MIRLALIALAAALFAALLIVGPSSIATVGPGMMMDGGSQAPPPAAGLTPPTEAANAGFTVLAMNLDFTGATQSSIGGGARTFNAQDFTTWFDTSGATSPIFWNGSLQSLPLSRISIINDGSGNTVLNMEEQPGDQCGTSCGPARNGLGVGYSTHMSSCKGFAPGSGGPCSITTPLSFYVEFIGRATPASLNSLSNPTGNPELANVWQFYTGTGVEFDFIEIFTNSSPTGQGNLGNGFWGFFGATPAGNGTLATMNSTQFTAYHKIGQLITSNGVDDVVGCIFVDDVLQNCYDQGNFWNGNPILGQRSQLFISGASAIIATVAHTVDYQLQWERIWVCPNWLPANGGVAINAAGQQTGGRCTGTSKFNSGGLIYWH